MATLEAAIDARKATQGAKEFSSASKRMARSARTVDKAIQRTTQGLIGFAAVQRRVSNSTVTANRKIARSSKSAGGSIFVMARRFKAMAAVAAAIVVARTIIKLTNQFQELTNKMKVVTDGTPQLIKRWKQLRSIADSTRTPLEDNIRLFQRLTFATKSRGTSVRELLQVQEALNQAVIVSGATAIEATNAIRQLTQAFARGVLRGDEFRSISEQLPEVLSLVAKAMGVPRDSMIALAEEGKITTEVMLKAFSKENTSDLAEDFGKTVSTLSQEWTKFRTETVAWGGVFNSIFGPGFKLGIKALTELSKLVRETGGYMGDAVNKWFIQPHVKAYQDTARAWGYDLGEPRSADDIGPMNDPMSFGAFAPDVRPPPSPFAIIEAPDPAQKDVMDAMIARHVQANEAFVESKRAADEARIAADKYMQLQSDPRRGVAEFAKELDQALTASAIAFDMTSELTYGLGNALTDVALNAKTAKEAFANMGRSMISTLINIATQMLMVAAIKAALGPSFFGGPSAAHGGTVSAPVRPGMEDNAHGGTISGPTSGYPVMLHGTERITPLNPVTKTPLKGGNESGSTNVSSVTFNVQTFGPQEFAEHFRQAAGNDARMIGQIAGSEMARDPELRAQVG